MWLFLLFIVPIQMQAIGSVSMVTSYQSWIQRNRQFVVLLIRTGAATNIGINKALHRRLLPGFVFCQCC